MATVGHQRERADGKTRIQALNESRIMAAAETIFADHGFRGAPVLGDYLRGPLKALAAKKCAVIEDAVSAVILGGILPRKP